MNVAAGKMGSVCCRNGEIDRVSTELGKMTPLLADDAVCLMVMVEEKRDGVTMTAVVARSGSVSMEELLQWMHTTGETGEEAMEETEETMEDALETSAIKTVTARTGVGTEDTGTEGAKVADAEIDATIEGVETEDVWSD